MKLINMKNADFIDLLASDAPAPGGGSVAALEGALGSALINMVAALTAGKEKYAEVRPEMQQIMQEATQLQKSLSDVMDRDTEAFNAVSAVFSMPKDTEEQKAARKDAMQKALKGCTVTPYQMMTCSMDALRLANRMLPCFNTNAASDLGVAALSLKAAIQGAWLNILINLGGIKDDAFVEEYRKNGQAILEQALPLADKIHSQVLESLQ